MTPADHPQYKEFVRFIQGEIESGNMDAEGMAERLVRYAMTSAKDMVAELNERMGNTAPTPLDSDIGDARLRCAVQNGLDSFWQKIAEAYPAATHGDLPPDVAIELEHYSRLAVWTWLDNNLPVGATR